MTLTPEHREALIAEAVRRASGPASTLIPHNGEQAAARHMYNLIEAGWKPEPKPSKALLAAREAAARHWEQDGNMASGSLARQGKADWTTTVCLALEAYNLGRESVLGEGAREVVLSMLGNEVSWGECADAILTALRERE